MQSSHAAAAAFTLKPRVAIYSSVSIPLSRFFCFLRDALSLSEREPADPRTTSEEVPRIAEVACIGDPSYWNLTDHSFPSPLVLPVGQLFLFYFTQQIKLPGTNSSFRPHPEVAESFRRASRFGRASFCRGSFLSLWPFTAQSDFDPINRLFSEKKNYEVLSAEHFRSVSAVEAAIFVWSFFYLFSV